MGLGRSWGGIGRVRRSLEGFWEKDSAGEVGLERVGQTQRKRSKRKKEEFEGIEGHHEETSRIWAMEGHSQVLP